MRQKALIFFLGALAGVVGYQLGDPFVRNGPLDNAAALEFSQPFSPSQQPSSTTGGVVNANAALAAPTGPESFKIHPLLSSIVRISSQTIAGSGVIIDPSGIVLTSAHLVSGSDRVSVEIRDGKWVEARKLHVDDQKDLALLILPPGEYPSATLGQAEDITLGSPVTVIGYPLNLPGWASVTRGIVSRVFTESGTGRELIQTDAAVNLGNSGGPILSQQGTVIGIISAIVGKYDSVPTTGISYAVSIKTIRGDFLSTIGK